MAYIALLERKAFLQGNPRLIFLTLLADLMSPGAFLSTYLQIRTNNTNVEFLSKKDGMDAHLHMNRAKLGLTTRAFEDSGSIEISMGLKKASRLRSNDVWEVVQLLLARPPGETPFESDRSSGFEKKKKFMWESFQIYATGDLNRMDDYCYRVPESLLSESNRKIYNKLIDFGMIQHNRDRDIARNLDWFRKLLNL